MIEGLYFGSAVPVVMGFLWAGQAGLRRSAGWAGRTYRGWRRAADGARPATLARKEDGHGRPQGIPDHSPRGLAAQAGRGAGPRLAEVAVPGALLPIIGGQAARCMDCGVPFCHEACPLGT
ncbi:hypothetical protein SFUMM280S_07580 [Streptomyces fumanus]